MSKRNRRQLDDDVKDVLAILDTCYCYSRPYFNRANEAVKFYEQIIDPATWQTMSEVTLGLGYRMVQNMLPNLLFSVLWAPENPFCVAPRDEDISNEDAEKIKDYLLYQLRDVMKIDKNGYNTVLDGVKIGSGYGIIEPKVIFTAQRTNTVLTAEGEGIIRSGLDIGEPTTRLAYRSVPFGSVMPSNDGEDPESASVSNFVDFIPEWDLRAMYAMPDTDLTGDVDEIIKYAKDNNMDATTFTTRSIIARLSGRKDSPESRYSRKIKNNGGMTLIPVIKQYRKNRHIWVAAGIQKIYDTEKSVQTLQPPLLKYTFAPESGQWFSRGVVDPNLDTMRATETWYNAVNDLFSLHLHPHQIVSTDAQPEMDGAEDLSPYAKTYVRGSVREAVSFVVPPALPQAVEGLGRDLQSFSDDAAGLNIPAGGQVSAGMVRGGSGAIESLLSSSSSREKLLAKHLENTWYAPLAELTMIYSALYADETDVFRIMSTDEEGNMISKAVRITRDDLQHAFKVSLNFREKYTNSITESAHRIQVYDRFKDNPDVNPKELIRYLIGDEAQEDKLLAGVNRVQRLSEIQQTSMAAEGAPAGMAGAGGLPAAGAGGGNPLQLMAGGAA